MNVIEYEVVTDPNPEKVGAKVKAMLAGGWQPWYGMTTYAGERVCQTMVKYAEPEPLVAHFANATWAPIEPEDRAKLVEAVTTSVVEVPVTPETGSEFKTRRRPSGENK